LESDGSVVDAVGGMFGVAVVAVLTGCGRENDEVTFFVVLFELLTSKTDDASGTCWGQNSVGTG
jgi:hypothetical protein